MIDPDNIIIPEKNLQTEIAVDKVPEFDSNVYDFEDPKDLKKYFTALERDIRSSFEYREMVQYLRNNFGMDQCSFIKVSNKDTKVRIEIHHYPFTLYDIVTIVYRKRVYYNEPLSLYLVSKECTMLHYKLLVGLISLSKTAHQLAHDGKLFIPVDHVLGRYRLFIDIYKQFCEPEQLETIERIELYSGEYSDLQDTNIFATNHITYNVYNEDYKLPDMASLQNRMVDRIQEIKDNGYRLPTLKESIENKNNHDTIEDRSSIIYPVRIDPNFNK